MRKLNNISKSMETSLENIKNSCSCAVVCEVNVDGVIPGYYLKERSGAIQRQWAFSGTMPQSVNKIDIL